MRRIPWALPSGMPRSLPQTPRFSVPIWEWGSIQIANPGGLVTINEGNTLTLAGGSNNADSTFGGVLRNTGSGSTLNLVKTGSGQLTLSGANTLTGSVTVTAGNLTINNANALGTISGLSIGGAQLGLNSNNAVVSAPITLTGNLSIIAQSSNMLLTSLNGPIDGNGNITFTTVSFTLMKLHISNIQRLPILGAICVSLVSYAPAATFYWDSTSPFSAEGFGNATGTWAQNSTGSGGRWTTSSTGSVAGNASQSHGVNDIYRFGSGTHGLGSGTITISGTVNMGDTHYSSLSGTITLTGGTINYGAARTITVNNTANTINSTVAGASTSLTKAGAGTLVFGGTNTYTGQTIINAGTLSLAASGSIDNSSGVLLGGGTFDVSAKAGGYTVGNLSGSGNVLGALTISTALSPGTSPGTINFADLSLASSATCTFDLTGGGTAADLANVSGTLVIDDATLDLVQLGTYTVGDKFTLFAYDTGNLTGAFDGLSDGSTFTGAGGLWQIDYADPNPGLNGGSGDSFVTITAIPEPAAALLGVIGMITLLRRRRS